MRSIPSSGGIDLAHPMFRRPRRPDVDVANYFRPVQDAVQSRRCAVASTAELAQQSAFLGKQVGVSLQVKRPALISGHALADALPALAVALEVAVLDLDPRALRGFGDEPYFPLTRFQQVVLDLPARADVPAQQHSAG